MAAIKVSTIRYTPAAQAVINKHLIVFREISSIVNAGILAFDSASHEQRAAFIAAAQKGPNRQAS
jgi:hypothetical protein